MPASEARIRANQLNAARSTGPKTPEGKERSRRNGMKHGMTGEGVIVHEGDLEEVDRRDEALRADLAPQSALGAILVRQMATLSVRMERGARQEFATLARRVRHAAEAFDEERSEEAGWLFETIADDPKGRLHRLRKSPEGVDRLVLAWRDLRADLAAQPRPSWSGPQMNRAANLVGLRGDDPRASRIVALSRATWGNFDGLATLDGEGLDGTGRRAWARERLLEVVDGEIADLQAYRESFDLDAIALDRAGAGDRALFDPSREASLARRYESEARRGFFRALKEFREAEVVELEEQEAATPTPTPTPTPEDGPRPDPLASSRAGSPPALPDPGPSPRRGSPAGSPTIARASEVARGADGRALAIGRPARGPA